MSTKLVEFLMCPQNWWNFQQSVLCCICIALVWHLALIALNKLPSYSYLKSELKTHFERIFLFISYIQTFIAKRFSQQKNLDWAFSVLFKLTRLCATSSMYRVDHMFGKALFCWLRVSWLKERKIFRLQNDTNIALLL